MMPSRFTHALPVMPNNRFTLKLTSEIKALPLIAYECPVCHYVEFYRNSMVAVGEDDE